MQVFKWVHLGSSMGKRKKLNKMLFLHFGVKFQNTPLRGSTVVTCVNFNILTSFIRLYVCSLFPCQTSCQQRYFISISPDLGKMKT